MQSTTVVQPRMLPGVPTQEKLRQQSICFLVMGITVFFVGIGLIVAGSIFFSFSIIGPGAVILVWSIMCFIMAYRRHVLAKNPPAQNFSVPIAPPPAGMAHINHPPVVFQQGTTNPTSPQTGYWGGQPTQYGMGPTLQTTAPYPTQAYTNNASGGAPPPYPIMPGTDPSQTQYSTPYPAQPAFSPPSYESAVDKK
ncbi:uncharacterized protein LOC120344515 [Styela clava]|uniref:protein transport protein SEC31-like n=1 Tax=Styela clava TaxID=7725 RepID=UPI001939FEBE|nr:protein transport protein SEC31-like [Styela clava]